MATKWDNRRLTPQGNFGPRDQYSARSHDV
jgi:hypothetical protein